MNIHKPAVFVASIFLMFADFGDMRIPGVPAYLDFVSSAKAVVGRPLTPVSYAGVARRTTRRVVRHTGVTIAALPAGCIYGPYYGSYYYRCGPNYYAKSGGVYVQVIVQ
jgi:hypothetical protein